MKWWRIILLSGFLVARGHAFDNRLPNPNEFSLRAQTHQEFASAWVVKPPETGDTNLLAYRLAPILILEDNSVFQSNAVTQAPALLARVYWAERRLTVGAKAWEQIAYFWKPNAASSSAVFRASALSPD